MRVQPLVRERERALERRARARQPVGERAARGRARAAQRRGLPVIVFREQLMETIGRERVEVVEGLSLIHI